MRKSKSANDGLEFGKEVFSVLQGKASEIHWCMFENRFRELVANLLQPLHQEHKVFNEKVLEQYD